MGRIATILVMCLLVVGCAHSQPVTWAMHGGGGAAIAAPMRALGANDGAIYSTTAGIALTWEWIQAVERGGFSMSNAAPDIAATMLGAYLAVKAVDKLRD